jgi:hypothetical protein
MTSILDVNGPTSPNFALVAAVLVPSLGSVEFTRDHLVPIHRLTLTLDDVVLPVPLGNEYIGVQIASLPDKNLWVFNAEVNITAVKGNATNGLGAADQVNIAVGTATAASAALNGADANIVPITVEDAATLTPAFRASKQSSNTTAVALHVADSATGGIWLNMSVTGAAGLTADDTLTCSGTIDLWVADFGNVTS